MKKIALLASMISSVFISSCSQDSFLGPGYRWDLFKNTPNWELAKAVAKEDTVTIAKLLKSGKFDVNFHEPQFGRTLLLLAVGNDKEKSTDILLKGGADINERDLRDDQPIHEAVQFISLKKNTLKILKLLLEHGANPSAISTKGSCEVPMVGAVDDSLCAKLLLQYNADIYHRTNDGEYVVWSELCSELFDNIYVAKYLIIDRKMPVPDPILYTSPSHEPRSFYQLLELSDFSNDSKKKQVKDVIISYLHSIGFPEKRAYQKK